MPSSAPSGNEARTRIRSFIFWLVVVTLTAEALVALTATSRWRGPACFLVFELTVS